MPIIDFLYGLSAISTLHLHTICQNVSTNETGEVKSGIQVGDFPQIGGARIKCLHRRSVREKRTSFISG